MAHRWNIPIPAELHGMSKDCYEAFAKVVAVANGDPDESMIVWCTDECMRLGSEGNEGYKQVLHCKQVGVSPWNRDGEGLVLSRAVSRGKNIRGCGFSFATMQADAVAFEDDPVLTPIAKATIDFTSVDPGCAKYKAHEVTFWIWFTMEFLATSHRSLRMVRYRGRSASRI